MHPLRIRSMVEPHRRSALAAVACLMTLSLHSTPAQGAVTAPDPMEGVWELEGCGGGSECVEGFVRVGPGGADIGGDFTGDGELNGVAFTDVTFAGPLDCIHEEGQSFWDIYPVGSASYSGYHKLYIDKGNGCEPLPTPATWTYDTADGYPWRMEFCAQNPGTDEWKCWEMKRYDGLTGTRPFGVKLDMKAKGTFVLGKRSKPAGYRQTRALSQSMTFDLMWSERTQSYVGRELHYGILTSEGTLTLTDVLGRGQNRRTQRTVLDLKIGRSVWPLPDEDGFVDKIEIGFNATVLRSNVRGCTDGLEGFVWLDASGQGEGVTVHMGDKCRYYTFLNGEPNADSLVDLRFFSLAP